MTLRLDADGPLSDKPSHTETISSSADLASLFASSGMPAREIRIPARKYVYRQLEQGDEFYLIKRGYVEVLTHLAVGQETIIDILGPGALCGEGAAFDGSPRLTSARALTDSLILRFRANELLSFLEGNGHLAFGLFNAISVKQRMLLRRLGEVAQLPPEKRVFRLLVQMSENSADGSVNISHEKLARLIGLTRVTVTRAIGKLQRRGEIARHKGRIVLAERKAAD